MLVAAPQPLGEFIRQKLQISARGAKRLLDARVVFVNGRRVWMMHHRLNAGDVVEIQQLAAAPSPKLENLTLYEDADYLIVNKPAGILANGQHSLETQLQNQYPKIQAVHRIDRDTSGCLIFAKSPAAFAAIVPLFRAGAVQKSYAAIVIGPYPAKVRKITDPLDGQTAISFVTPVKISANASYLNISIVTGRTHQIRRHLTALGCPIAGDKNYGGSKELPPLLRKIPRQLLHAQRVALISPSSGKTIEATAPLPQDFEEWLGKLNLKSLT